MAIQEHSENKEMQNIHTSNCPSFHFITDRDAKASLIHSCGIERTAGKKLNTKEVNKT